MKILIKITKDVLEKTANCEMNKRNINCAIAYAVRNIFPTSLVYVDRIVFEGKSFYIPLPISAKAFISRFDHSTQSGRLQIEPITFEIEVPNEAIEMIGIGEVYRVLSESRTLELVHP